MTTSPSLTLWPSLTTAVTANEGLGSHFDWVPICVCHTRLMLVQSWRWGLRTSNLGRTTWNVILQLAYTLCKLCNKKIMCVAHFLLKLYWCQRKYLVPAVMLSTCSLSEQDNGLFVGEKNCSICTSKHEWGKGNSSRWSALPQSMALSYSCHLISQRYYWEELTSAHLPTCSAIPCHSFQCCSLPIFIIFF